MDANGVIRKECFSLNPRVIDGRVECSTWVSFDDLNPDDICSDRFEGIEARFPLAEVVNDLIVGHGFHDGTVSLEAQPTMLAIRAELEEMIRQIDAVKYAAE
jgi:hypothetical protein